MPSASLSSKGQITIPASVRKALHVDTGDRVDFIEIEPERYEFVAVSRSVRALKGMFGKPRRKVSIEQMARDIAREGAKGR